MSDTTVVVECSRMRKELTASLKSVLLCQIYLFIISCFLIAKVLIVLFCQPKKAVPLLSHSFYPSGFSSNCTLFCKNT